MAIPSGSGTEVLKNIMWEDVTTSADAIFTGVQHHIYTIISIIVTNIHSSSVTVTGNIRGYDSYGSANDQYFRIFRSDIPQNGTFVFNDKFVLYGQGLNSGAQKLHFSTTNVSDIVMTYIDQDFT